MRKTLYLKFILAYFIFGFFGFIVVATFVPNMTFEHLKREKAEDLYSEATLIAGTYASGLYTNETSLDTVKSHLDALGVYLAAGCGESFHYRGFRPYGHSRLLLYGQYLL